MRMMVDEPFAATHRLPAKSNARPAGASMPLIATEAVGFAALRSSAAILTTLSSATTETQRFPWMSNASTRAPGIDEPKLLMTMSGVFAPSVSNSRDG